MERGRDVSQDAIALSDCARRFHDGQYAPVFAWPPTREGLIEEQERLAALSPRTRRFEPEARIGAAFVCFLRGAHGPGQVGDPAWAARASDPRRPAVQGYAGAPYERGLLALREGALLETAVRALTKPPDLLLVDATGRDHPRRAGLALQLGAIVGVPTVGVTHRPLVAEGDWPADERRAHTPLLLGGELVGYWLRTKMGTRPLAVHAAWRTDPATAAEIVLSASRARTPEPLRTRRGDEPAKRARSLAAMIGVKGGSDGRRDRLP